MSANPVRVQEQLLALAKSCAQPVEALGKWPQTKDLLAFAELAPHVKVQELHCLVRNAEEGRKVQGTVKLIYPWELVMETGCSRGRGDAGMQGGPRGDLYVDVNVNHKFFKGTRMTCSTNYNSFTLATLGEPYKPIRR